MAKFYMFEVSLFKCVGITNKSTGVCESISPVDKVVYLHMRDRYRFNLEKGGRFYDSLETIARACGLGRTTVNKSICKWQRLGVVIKDTRRDDTGHRITFYQVNELTSYLLK